MVERKENNLIKPLRTIPILMKSTIRTTIIDLRLCHELHKIGPPCAHCRQHGPPRAIVVLPLYPFPACTSTHLLRNHNSHWITHDIQIICSPFASLSLFPPCTHRFHTNHPIHRLPRLPPPACVRNYLSISANRIKARALSTPAFVG